MKKSLKKIVLAKETIRNLSVFEATAIAGGISTNVCTHTSDFRACGTVSISVCPAGTGC
jgi:hypothetical protein